MDNFNEYLKGSQFTLYANEMPVPELGTTQTKTWNRLRMAMNKHKFLVQNRQKADLPEHLKHFQHHQTGADINQIDTLLFNYRIHVDLLPTNLGNSIITMNTLLTHYRLSFQTTVKKNCSKLFQKNWFKQYGIPREIHFKKGKVEVSQLTQKINQLALPTDKTKVQGKSWNSTFNTEIECQWKLTHSQIPEEDFVTAVNFFHELQNPVLDIIHRPPTLDSDMGDKKLIYNLHEDDHEGTEEEDEIKYNHWHSSRKRKMIWLCHHKHYFPPPKQNRADSRIGRKSTRKSGKPGAN